MRGLHLGQGAHLRTYRIENILKIDLGGLDERGFTVRLRLMNPALRNRVATQVRLHFCKEQPVLLGSPTAKPRASQFQTATSQFGTHDSIQTDVQWEQPQCPAEAGGRSETTERPVFAV